MIVTPRSDALCKTSNRKARFVTASTANLQALIIQYFVKIRILLAHNFAHVLFKIFDLYAGHLAEESASQRRGEYQSKSNQTGLHRCISPWIPMEEATIGQRLHNNRRQCCCCEMKKNALISWPQFVDVQWNTREFESLTHARHSHSDPAQNNGANALNGGFFRFTIQWIGFVVDQGDAFLQFSANKRSD